MRKANLNGKYKESNRKSKMMKRLNISNLANNFPHRVKYIGSDKPKYEIVDLLDVDQLVFYIK
jgi:hypothetical protein